MVSEVLLLYIPFIFKPLGPQALTFSSPLFFLQPFATSLHRSSTLARMRWAGCVCVCVYVF